MRKDKGSPTIDVSCMAIDDSVPKSVHAQSSSWSWQVLWSRYVLLHISASNCVWGVRSKMRHWVICKYAVLRISVKVVWRGSAEPSWSPCVLCGWLGNPASNVDAMPPNKTCSSPLAWSSCRSRWRTCPCWLSRRCSQESAELSSEASTVPCRSWHPKPIPPIPAQISLTWWLNPSRGT